MGVSTGARGMGAQEAQRLYQVRGPALRSPLLYVRGLFSYLRPTFLLRSDPTLT